MSRVTFRNGTNAITVDVSVSRTWRPPIYGAPGTATLSLPLDSPAASAAYINPNGGSWLTVHATGDSGEWHGLTRAPRIASAGTMTIEARQPWDIFGRRFCDNGLTLRNVSIGYVVTVAIRQALNGLHWLSVPNGPFEAATGHIEEFQFTGQDFWGLCADLMERGTGELHVDAETLALSWCGAFASAPYYPVPLIGGVDLEPWEFMPDTEQRISEVIATRGDETYIARRGDAAVDNWPAQTTIQVDEFANLTAAAHAELEARQGIQATISGIVTPDHYGIRERGIVQVVLPGGDFTGGVHVGRVVERTLDDARGMSIVVQSQADESPRARPSTRAASGGGHGSGTLGQQVQGLRRRVARAETRVAALSRPAPSRSAIPTQYFNSATLDFPSIAAGAASELTITVTGASVGQQAWANPGSTLEAGLVWSAYVSAINTITIRLANITGSAIDPASRSWNAGTITQ